MLKLSLKQGQYVNIGDDIRVVYVGGSGNHARLLIDAPRELNIARSTTEEYTYYADPQQVDFTLRMTVPALANEVLLSLIHI